MSSREFITQAKHTGPLNRARLSAPAVLDEVTKDAKCIAAVWFGDAPGTVVAANMMLPDVPTPPLLLITNGAIMPGLGTGFPAQTIMLFALFNTAGKETYC